MSIPNDVAACPLCGKQDQMGKRARLLYDTPVCKKCHAEFASRRQCAFIVDLVILWILRGYVFAMAGATAAMAGIGDFAAATVYLLISAGLLTIFCMKDGFSGKSPGKALVGVQVLDATTGLPAGCVSSFRRNLPTLLPFVPLLIGLGLNRGGRIGDGWSHTKVIWTKYRNAAPFATSTGTPEPVVGRSLTAPF